VEAEVKHQIWQLILWIPHPGYELPVNEGHGSMSVPLMARPIVLENMEL